MESTPQNYQLFDNLLFTDTFETYDSESKGFKGDSLKLENAEYFAKNLSKINEFKNQEFKVIFGNPPYSAGQKSTNDDNKNTFYPALVSRIENSYVKFSKAASKRTNYDSYKMAIRYASDRIENNGIVAFVSNGSFIEGNSDDGLRACLEAEFDEIYIFNLRGNIRKNMQTRDGTEGENIFGNASQTPVAIFLLIKCSANSQKATIRHYNINNSLGKNSRKTRDKLNLIANLKSIKNLENQWEVITPNKHYDWINQRDENFDKFTPIADKELKLKPLEKNSKINFFKIFSMGIGTNRDAWAYNFSKENLAKNMKFMIENYNGEVDKFKGKKPKEYEKLLCLDKTKISWSSSLISKVGSGIQTKFSENKITLCLYRPFCKTFLYYDSIFNHRQGQMPLIYPNSKKCQNLTILISGDDGRGGALMSNLIIDNEILAHTQAFPLYYYEKIENAGSGNLFENSQNATNSAAYRRKDGIRDEALCEIRRKYKDEKITKEDIFYYIYALLNHKGYKEKYKDNLSKMLPRIPFVKDFWGFCKIGRELAALHLNYENFAESCRAKVVAKGEYKEASGLFGKDGGEFLADLNEGDFRLEKMRFVSKGKRDTIFFNEKIAITQIPQSAYDYVVNGRSGVEWIMERYQVKTDKDSGIKNDPNLFECDSGALASGFDNGGADLTGLANSNGGVGGAVNVGFGGGSALSGLKGGKYALYLLLSVIEMSALSVEILDKLADFGLDEVE